MACGPGTSYRVTSNYHKDMYDNFAILVIRRTPRDQVLVTAVHLPCSCSRMSKVQKGWAIMFELLYIRTSHLMDALCLFSALHGATFKFRHAVLACYSCSHLSIVHRKLYNDGPCPVVDPVVTFQGLDLVLEVSDVSLDPEDVAAAAIVVDAGRCSRRVKL
jgi:hypothetical protein